MKQIPFWVPQIEKKEFELVTKVLKSNFINEGLYTKEFEDKIRKIINVKYAIAVSSGTAALFCALKGLGIKQGDEVIVPNITFIATANAVSLTGAKPILADVNPHTLTINPSAIKKVISKSTKAIIPVHISGRPAQMKQIMTLARQYSLFVIEDAAEALMSQYKGKYLGTIGIAGCFSFSPNKTITTGQGGMVVTNNKNLAQMIRKIKDQGRLVRGTGGNDRHNSIGYNFKLTNLQAAVGLGQINLLKKRTERLKKHYLLYKQHLSEFHQIKLLPFLMEKGEVPQWIDALAESRDNLITYLLKNGFGCRKFWFPLNTQKSYYKSSRLFPISSLYAKKAFWLPSAFILSNNDIIYVCKLIKNFYSK